MKYALITACVVFIVAVIGIVCMNVLLGIRPPMIPPEVMPF